ncbi:hypothetical protein PQX77_009626 [Marasmius sp. AFHP31]|nr:hypothetical protein PQX77_009626 [Marasmius sp. AFHP31]
MSNPWADGQGGQDGQGGTPEPDPNTPAQITIGNLANIQNSFTSLQRTLASQQELIDQLIAQVSVMNTQPQPPPPPRPPTPPPIPPPPPPVQPSSTKPTFKEPNIFKGKPEHVEPFWDLIEDAIDLQSAALPTPRHKSIYAAGYFGDSGRIWYRGVKNSDPSLLDNFSAFKQAFRDHFGDKNLAYNSKLKIRALHQTGTAAAYIARFRELVVYVDWSHASRIDELYERLKPETKDAVSNTSRSDRPTSFDAYCQFVIDCDNRVQERIEERKHESKSNGSNGNGTKNGKSNGNNGNGNNGASSKSNNSSSRVIVSTPSTSTSVSTPSSSSLPMGEPMEVDATTTKRYGPISDAERKRRKDTGACMYCGVCGKTAETCPNRSPAVVKRMEQQRAARETKSKAASPSGKA